MVRVLVLLLIQPAMLMPPGMCICQFFPIGKVTYASANLQRPVGQADHHQSDCSCESCAFAKTTSVPECGDDRPNHHAPPQQPSAPSPGKHCPGCPAAVGESPLTFAVPTVTVQADLIAVATFYSPRTESVVPRERVAPPSPTPASPPLFISYCSLLI